MYPLGHYGVALLFAAPAALVVGRRRGALFTLFALCVTMLPDLDKHLPLTHHHGGMHTLLFAVSGGIAISVVFTAFAGGYHHLVRDDRFRVDFRERSVFLLSASAFFVGIVGHIVADAVARPINGNLLRPFWPASDVVVELRLILPGEPVWNVGLFAAGLAVQAMVLYRWPSVANRTAREPTRD